MPKNSTQQGPATKEDKQVQKLSHAVMMEEPVQKPGEMRGNGKMLAHLSGDLLAGW